jgi:hypothetical protein
MSDLVCNTREEAIAALEAIIGSTPQGKTKEALRAVEDWLVAHTRPAGDSDYVIKKLERLLHIKESEQRAAGSAWRKAAERFRRGELPQMPEPADRAEVTCAYNAEAKLWQPVTLEG